MPPEDYVIITIDCWRQDGFTPTLMPQLMSVTEGWERRTLLTAGGSTPDAFPGLLGSNLPHIVCDTGKQIKDDYISLPSVLEEAGYATGFFAASNPFLGIWSSEFGSYWNDGMLMVDADANRPNGLWDKASRFVQFQPRVADREVLDRARNYWETATPPRFVWCHLMGPHEPYYPGIRRASQSGLFRSYLSILGSAKFKPTIPAWMERHLRQLYDQCVRQLDTTLAPFVRDMSDQATVVITGDHGEEFDHDRFGHGRLYNEVVRCPYITNDPEMVPDASGVRQFDLAPTICNSAGLAIPEQWEGQVADYRSTPLQPVVVHETKKDLIHIGVHDESRKLIRSFDEQTGELVETERYDLIVDPFEQSPMGILSKDEELVTAVREVRNSGYRQFKTADVERTIDSDVKDRLSELGYT